LNPTSLVAALDAKRGILLGAASSGSVGSIAVPAGKAVTYAGVISGTLVKTEQACCS
jgi:hypothetical protein